METERQPDKFEFLTEADFKPFLDGKTSSRGGASSLGHHFIQAYNENKWGFYLRYIRGLESNYTKPALVFGGALHDAKEAFYRFHFDTTKMIETFRGVLEARKKEYEDPTTFERDITDGPKMLFYWANTWGPVDEYEYEIVEVEGSHEFQLANGLSVSVRWDLLARHLETGKYYLFDTKSTRYSLTKSYQSVEGQDQATMYLLGLSKVYPGIFRSTIGLVPDIIYKSSRGNVMKAERPGIVMRGKNALREYEQELIGLHMELSQKVAALETGFPYPHMLFPRNGKDDSFFGSDWPDIYRTPLPRDPSKAPPGYHVNQDIIDAGPMNPALRSTEDFTSIQEGDIT